MAETAKTEGTTAKRTRGRRPTNPTEKLLSAKEELLSAAERERLILSRVKIGTTRGKKQVAIAIYAINLGNISQICRKIKTHRSTWYDWLETDERFKAAIKVEEESLLDLAESTMYASLASGDRKASEFVLKTKGKKRGWVPRQEVTGADGESLTAGLGMTPSEIMEGLEQLLIAAGVSPEARDEVLTKLKL